MQKPLLHRKRVWCTLLTFIFLIVGTVIVVPVVIETRKKLQQQQTNGILSGTQNGQNGQIGQAGQTAPQVVPNQDRANAVKDAFRFAWQGYRSKAFPHDELHPGTNTPGDSRNGWGATAIDGLDTAIIMQMSDVVADILNFVPTIDYTRTATQVNVFETNIRYLGGMLSAYDLLKGPFSNLPHDATKREQLLQQSKKLADLLSVAFTTPSGIPDNILNFNGGTPTINGSSQASIATIGTLTLEWARLSRLLNDPKYAKLTQTAQQYLLNPKAGGLQPFPGLLGQYVRTSDGTIFDQRGGWGPESDSFYEYLIKMYVYKPSDFANYRDRWTMAADSSMQYLASHPSSRQDITFMGHFDGTKILPMAWHLDCFAGGNFILAGSVLRQQKYTDFGLQLVNGCHDSYSSTATSIGPEAFQWLPGNCASAGPNSQTVQLKANTTFSKVTKAIQASMDCSQQPPDQHTSTFFQTSGLWIKDGSYNLRPEVLESYYYAYRITNNPMYQDWAWDAFNAIQSNSRLSQGFNVLGNVDIQGGDNTHGNEQESYFFAETLKYAYLIFSDDGPWQVNYQGRNDFVFNTEGHPIRIAS